MRLDEKYILITGGAGFIGSHTAHALLEKNARVYIIDNLSSGRKENIPPRTTFVNSNLEDNDLSKLFPNIKFDMVYHFAFNVNVPAAVRNPLIEIPSIAGSINLFEYCRNTGVKHIVFASSEFIYGNSQNFPLKESEPHDPATPYSVSKYSVENYLHYYRKAYGMKTTIFRYSTVYGPRQIHGAMTDYIRKLSSHQQAEIWGDGEKTRDYVFIDDVVRANLLALELPERDDNVFNIGTGIETSLNTVYSIIAEELEEKASPIYHEDRSGERYRSCLDASKMFTIAGWTPKISLKEGLHLKIQEYLKNKPAYDHYL